MKTPEEILKKCCTENDDPYLLLKLDMGGGKVADKKFKALLERFGVSSTALAARLSLMKRYGV